MDLWNAKSRRPSSLLEESRSLLKQLARGRELHRLQQARCRVTKPGQTSMLPGILTLPALLESLASHGTVILLSVWPFFILAEYARWTGETVWRARRGMCNTEIFCSLEAITSGMVQVVHTSSPTTRAALGIWAPLSHLRVAGLPPLGIRKFGSLLELAEACDVPVRWSCRSGVCHTCMTGLIGGSITYNPELLERPARLGNVPFICCSQPAAGAALDL